MEYVKVVGHAKVAILHGLDALAFFDFVPMVPPIGFELMTYRLQV